MELKIPCLCHSAPYWVCNHPSISSQRHDSPRVRSLFLSRQPTRVCWIRPSKWVSDDGHHCTRKCYRNPPNLSEIDHQVPLNMFFSSGETHPCRLEECACIVSGQIFHFTTISTDITYCIPPKLPGAFGSIYDILVRSPSLTFPLSPCLHCSHSQWIGFWSRQSWYFVGHVIVPVQSLQIALDFLVVR